MRICFLTFFTLLSLFAAAQKNYYFSKLTVEDGLNDGHIQAIGEDKFGYMWFASLGGLSRYDGRTFKTFSHVPGDSSSILSGLALCLVTDSIGQLLVGFQNGLMTFDFQNDNFHEVESAKNLNIGKILPIAKDRVLVAEASGLWEFSSSTHQITRVKSTGEVPLTQQINDLYYDKGSLIIALETGLARYDLTTRQCTKIPLPDEPAPVLTVSVDQSGSIWYTSPGAHKISRLLPDLKTVEHYDRFLDPTVMTISSNCRVMKDKNQRIWVSAKYTGLLEYIPETNSFDVYACDEQRRWTLSTNSNIAIFSDSKGNIWLGGNKGVNMFNPERTLFRTILPFKTELNLRERRSGRAVVEDKNHQLWFGTMDGLVWMDRATGNTREWRNEPDKPPILVRNQIRHLYCDHNNNLWISSNKGVNFFDQKTAKITLFQPGDFTQTMFHMFTFEDNNQRMWFLTINGDGIYYMDPGEEILHSVKDHPDLKHFKGMGCWSMLQDHKGRYWWGFEQNGVAMYDPATHETITWNSQAEGALRVACNLVFDIKEDKNGIIWAASSAGLVGIDVDHKKQWLFNNSNGLGSNTAMQVAVDPLNRIWIGTGRGLLMLDSSRTHFTAFGQQDGLPTTLFMESQAINTSAGEIIMATQNGYILFNPLQYQTANKPVQFYAPSYQVFNKEYPLPELKDKPSTIYLKSNENFFTLNLRAINFINPSQNWYAYKLEGFDPDWHYSKDPRAVYTNVPGGKYTFRYKATIDPNDWSVQEKTIVIVIDTIFYKTWWFWLLNLLGIGLAVFYIVNQRIRNAQNWNALKSKTQLLEKEKTAVMYENLKQHLNPHFLFNSLASLSSLIRLDQKMAVDFLDKMSKVYRYILKNKDKDTVPLIDELNFVDMYIQLQKTRFEDGLQVRIDIPESFHHRKIVPVTLQNLVENALKHNITDPDEPLIVEIFIEDDYLVVRNNLQLKSFVETSNKQGLSSMISLYHFLCERPVIVNESTEFYMIRVPLL